MIVRLACAYLTAVLVVLALAPAAGHVPLHVTPPVYPLTP